MPVILNGHEIQAHRGKSLFDYADHLRVRVPTSCGRGGSCHECVVEVHSGRRACFPTPATSTSFPATSGLPARRSLPIRPRPLSSASCAGSRASSPRGYGGASNSPPSVRLDGDEVTGGGQPLDTYRGRILGVAADIGTTTVAMNLVDLESGEIIATSSFENPQKFGGSDVMNRISFDSGRNRGELRLAIISAINFEIGELTRQANVHRRQISDAVLVGNTTMRDIAFGINVQSVGVKPYKSAVEIEWESGQRQGTALQSNAQAIGLRVFPRAQVYGGPLIGCHVGSDVAAGLLAVGMGRAGRAGDAGGHRHEYRGGDRQQERNDGGLVPCGASLRGRPGHPTVCPATTGRWSPFASWTAARRCPPLAGPMCRASADRDWWTCCTSSGLRD